MKILLFSTLYPSAVRPIHGIFVETRLRELLNTGEVQAKVLLASADDVDTAVASAVEAQKEWAAWNPQKRARVLMKFIELVNANADEIAELLSLEHGKTVADSLGDIQRGIEVIEFATGIPHLMKGEFTEGAGPGIDVYSIRQPLGVVCGITPFNFPAMIPLWKAGPALACGNAFILKPSERDPSVPLRLAPQRLPLRQRLAPLMQPPLATRLTPPPRPTRGTTRCSRRHGPRRASPARPTPPRQRHQLPKRTRGMTLPRRLHPPHPQL